MTTRRFILTLGLGASTALGAGTLAGCRGERSDLPPRQFIPDMDDSPKFKPQTQTEFFADGRAMRPRMPGTVAFGVFSDAGSTSDQASPLERTAARLRTDLLKDDEAFYFGTAGMIGSGADAKPNYVATIPPGVKVTQELLDRGQQRFNIYCSACHGYQGDGQGTVGQQWQYLLPSFYDPKYRDPKVDQGKDGYIFHTIRYGVPGAADGGYKMPPYADKVNERDAWAIVAWIRVMQETRSGDLSTLPAERRAEIERQIKEAQAKAAGGMAPAPAAGSGAPAGGPAGSTGGGR